MNFCLGVGDVIMALSLKDVEAIAHLARLELSEAQARKYQEQLSAILDYAAMLNALDLADIPPTTHAVVMHNVLREDRVEPSLLLAEVLANAPQHTADQFLIQAVFEN